MHRENHKISLPFFFLTAFIALVVWLAAHFGWLNDDALNYVVMAQHMLEGHWPSLRPSWGDPYWAVFPFGYPLAIAAAAWVLPVEPLAASKIVNGVLLAASIGLASHWLRLPLVLTTSLFLTASVLEIVSYSWSENLFLFSQLALLACLSRYLEHGRKAALLGLMFALLASFSARYIGGLLLPAYGAALLAMAKYYPHRRILMALGVLVLAALVFAGYLYLNKTLTGEWTGMARRPAVESFGLLSMQFAMQLGLSLWMMAPPLLIVTMVKTQSARIRLSREAVLLMLFGGIYLAGLFLLRNLSHFEQFSQRLLMPGVILAYLGGLKILYDARGMASGRTISAFICVMAALLNLGITYRELLMAPVLALHTGTARAMQAYEEKYGVLPEGTVIISGGYDNPTMGWRFISPIFSSDRLFYVVADNYPLPLEEYHAYLRRLRYKTQPPVRYVFDFTEFPTLDAFEAMLARRGVNKALGDWMKRHFAPNRFVECADCLNIGRRQAH